MLVTILDPGDTEMNTQIRVCPVRAQEDGQL